MQVVIKKCGKNYQEINKESPINVENLYIFLKEKNSTAKIDFFCRY